MILFSTFLIKIQLGYSEFHHPDPQKMLKWLNHTANYLDRKYGKDLYTKVHVSTGQDLKNFKDPHTGKSLNFNFLPYYADKTVGVLPHTVQFYNLDQKLSSYGNSSFDHIRKFLNREMTRRNVIWFPETAYWVGFDVDVPLFLPIYAYNRVHDIRLIKGDELRQNSKIKGQLIFSSGWEWGYWLNDVVAARASWKSSYNENNTMDSTGNLLQEIFSPFNENTKELIDILTNIINIQNKYFSFGDEPNHDFPFTTEGQAYFQGLETWKEISAGLNNYFGIKSAGFHPIGMPISSLKKSTKYKNFYKKFLRDKFKKIALLLEKEKQNISLLKKSVSPNLRNIIDEFEDSITITLLRVRHVDAVYEGAYYYKDDKFKDFIKKSQNIIEKASVIVSSREKRYRKKAKFISGYRDNPTSYPFMYLWSVSSLYYWKRDLLKLKSGGFWNPCRYNIFDPFMVSFGANKNYDRYQSFLTGKIIKALFPVTSQCFYTNEVFLKKFIDSGE